MPDHQQQTRASSIKILELSSGSCAETRRESQTQQKVAAADLFNEDGPKINSEDRLVAVGKSIMTALYHIRAKTLRLIVEKRSNGETL